MGVWRQKVWTFWWNFVHNNKFGMQWQSLDQIWYFFLKSKMVSWARGLRLMRSTSAAKFGWSSGIASANTATAKPWPLTANRTVNILVLWGIEIKHMHNYDETWVSPCHVVQENEKPGKKTANINPKKLRSVITVKAHCSVTRIIQPKNHLVSCPPFDHGCNIWLLLHPQPNGGLPNCIRRH